MATEYANLKVIAVEAKTSAEFIDRKTSRHDIDVLQPGAIVRHFKGKLYEVLGIAVHTETADDLVIYKALYPPYGVYARPRNMFLSKVDEEKYPEHAGEWRLRIATKEEIQGCEKNASRQVSQV